MSRVVVVGSVNSDTSLHVARLPGPGETVLATSSSMSAGGKGANQACAVVRAGAACRLVGAVGDDATGDFLAGSLAERGVELGQLLRLPGVESGGATVIVDEQGENCIVVTGGANAALTPDQVVAGLAAVPDVGLVLTQGELSPECVAAAAGHAAQTGARFVHNLAPYRPVSAELLALCDPLVVNEHEAADLAAALGGPVDADADATLALLQQHCRSVVVTFGADGAAYSSSAGTDRRPALQVEVVDTTGAGDAFVGAAAASLLTDDDLGRACAAGVAAGAAAVQHPGALP